MHMFEEGNLLKFSPFNFKNGATPKDKYFIVLKNVNDGLRLATLPTSKDHVPSDITNSHGCIELPDRQVNVYVFDANEIIANVINDNSPFSFALNTFVYGADVETYPIVTFKQQIKLKLTSIQLLAKLTPEKLADLQYCLKNSKMVKNKYRKML